MSKQSQSTKLLIHTLLQPSEHLTKPDTGTLVRAAPKRLTLQIIPRITARLQRLLPKQKRALRHTSVLFVIMLSEQRRFPQSTRNTLTITQRNGPPTTQATGTSAAAEIRPTSAATFQTAELLPFSLHTTAQV